MEDSTSRDEIELRPVTALFTDVVSFSARSKILGPAAGMRLFRAALSFLAEICREHGGTLQGDAGDDILVLFGVPKAMENSARAAINAAIEMHNRIGDWSREQRVEPPIEIHTGINGGQIASGMYVTREAVHGPVVNLAARLVKEAQRGQIFVGAETWRATRNDFEFRDLGPIELKNIDAEVVHELISRTPCIHRPPPSPDEPLVGRERERASLERSVKEVLEGRGGLVTLVGEAGLGKSRLLAELGASELVRSATWLDARSLQIGSNLSYHPFADLLRSWARIPEQESGAAVLGRLETALAGLFGSEGEELIPFLANLLGVEPDAAGREHLAGITGDAMERQVFHAISQLLRRLAARRPLVLFFEDLHWADVSSLELLARLLRLATELPILFLIALRPDPPRAHAALAAAGAELSGLRQLELELRPLDRDAAEELIDQIFANGDLPNAARRLIEERSAGNPFYLGEIVRSLLEQGALERRGDALFATGKIESISIPPTVQEVIAARADRLPDSARRVLQAAAILGRDAYRRILEEIAEADDLETDLARLDSAQLLVPRKRAGEIVFQFKHPLIQQAIYEGIEDERRQPVHARIARAIETTPTASGAAYHAMLAYHWTQAGEAERAEVELSRACDAGGATSEALEFLEDAARLLLQIPRIRGDSRTEVLIHRKLAVAYLRRGKMREGSDHLDTALVLLGQRRRGTHRERALRSGLAMALVVLDLYLRGDRARRPAASERDCEIIDLMYASAQAQVTADPTGFLFDSMEGLHRLNQVDPASVPGAGGIYAGAVGFIDYTGLSFGVGDRLLRRAARFVNADDPRELCGYRVFDFVHHFFAGDWDDRHMIDSELLDENIRLAEFWHVFNYLPLDAKRRAHQGRFAEAAEILERIGKIGDLYDYDLARSNELAVRMFLELEQDRFEVAWTTADAYFKSFKAHLLFNLLALGTRAKIELLLGRRAEAEQTLERAREIARRTRFVPPFHDGAVRLAELRLALVRLEQAREEGGGRPSYALRAQAGRAAARALACARKVAWQRPEAFALAGSCAWLLGRRRNSHRHWGEAVDEAERLGARPELARIWREIARRLEEGGPRARFRGLDATASRARGDEVARSLH